MFVPGHVVSMYVATGGASGMSLGSDEKEIILLVFAIIDAAANKVNNYEIDSVAFRVIYSLQLPNTHFVTLFICLTSNSCSWYIIFTV